MSEEKAEAIDKLVSEGYEIIGGLGDNPSAEAKQEAANQLERLQNELKQIAETDSQGAYADRASVARDQLLLRGRAVGLPKPSVTPPTPASKQPQTKSGAGGTGGAGRPGYPLPTYPGGDAKSAAERLDAIRKMICAHLAKYPGRKDPQAAADWRQPLDELINEMCLAEETLIMERSGGFTPDEIKTIEQAYGGFDDVNDMLEDLGEQNKEIAKLQQQYDEAVSYYHGQLRAGADGVGPGALSRSGPNIGSGIGLVVSEQIQRALIKAENIGTKQEQAIRERLEQADAKVQQALESRRRRGIEQVNKDLRAEAGDGATPETFEIHKPASGDWQNKCEAVIHEMHGSSMSGRPPIKWTDNTMGARSGATAFDVTGFARDYCGRPLNHRGGALRKAAIGGGAVVAVGLIALGIWQATSGGDATEEAEPEIAIGEDPPIVTEEFVDEPEVADEPAPEPESEPTDQSEPEPTAPSEPEPADEPEPDPEPRFFTPGGGCGDVTHSSPPGSDAPSFFWYAFVAITEQGLAPDGTTIGVAVDGSDTVVEFVTDGGVAGGTFPIFSYGDYPLSVVSADGPAGPLQIVDGATFDVVSVDAAEGPIGGCLDPAGLSPGDVDVIAAGATFPAILVEEPDAIPAPEDDLGPYREFLTRFDLAHRTGDADALFDTLHPAVLDRYAAAQCRTYLEATVGSIGELFLIDGFPEPWDYPTDGLTTDIPAAWTIDMEATITADGSRQSFEFHLVDTPDGVRWFTDCGEPV